jgi:hypothetical protein
VKYILSLLIASNLLADPSKVFSYLMDEPVSLLDIGIYKMSKQLEDWDMKLSKDIEKLTYVNSYSQYLWNDNTLLVTRSVGVDDSYNAKTLCKYVINNTKYFFNVDNNATRDKGYAGIGTKWFSHNGYSNNKRPKELDNLIEKRTKVRVYINSKMKNKKIIQTQCQAFLLSKEISFVE